MFSCANGRCVPISLYCDQHDDCGDESDEDLCCRFYFSNHTHSTVLLLQSLKNAQQISSSANLRSNASAKNQHVTSCWIVLMDQMKIPCCVVNYLYACTRDLILISDISTQPPIAEDSSVIQVFACPTD